jgi:crotonobetaine/carnitine-CoA ligase
MSALPLRERVCGKILAARAREIGDSPFVHFAGEWHSFAQMSRRANQVAHALAQLDVRAGERVAILLRNRLEYLDLWFGLSRIGAVQVPINCEYKAAQMLHVLRRAPVKLVVVERALVSELSTAIAASSGAPAVLLVEDSTDAAQTVLPTSLAHARSYADVVSEAPGEDPAAAVDVSGADAGVVMNTSGTTGPSKGVVLSHAQQFILGRNIAADMRLRSSDVYYNFFPLFHNTAQAMITLPVLLSGARMVLVERFSASRFWSEARLHGCTAFYYIGEILRILLRTPSPDVADSPLRIGWGIGASARDMGEFQDRFGIPLRTGYGSTEANVPCFMPDDARAGRCGRAIDGFEIRIANEAGEPVASGIQGEILIRSSEPYALMLGYDGDATSTVAAWRDLWFHSGDTGFLDPDGQLTFTGRLKDVMRVRGENVSAFEVEEAIAALEGVLEVAAIAVPCELGGDDVKVVIVRGSTRRLEPENVIEWASRHLPRYAVPRYVEFVTALPKTPTNKVQKHVLRQQPFTAQTWERSREN